MNDLLITNARILHQPDCNIVGVDNGVITLLEHSNNLSQSEFDSLLSNSRQCINANNHWLTPGLVDCHTHLVFAGSRANEFAARLEGKSYQEITAEGGGINATVKSTREASFDDLIKISEQRIEQIINNGVTTLEIKSGYGLDLATEKKILQVVEYLDKNYPITIQKTFLGAHVLAPEYTTKKEYITYLATEVLPDLVQHNLVDAVDGFCEGIAFSPQELEPLYQAASELGLLIKGHTEQLSAIGGAELICQYQGVSCDHLEYADRKEVEKLASNNVVAVLLPGAYYYLKETQKPRVNLLREHQVPIALATDFNPGTSPVLSLPIIMNMGCVLYGLTPKEVWQAVTINAAKALAMHNKLGTLELGKQADMVLWDFEHPYDLCYYMNHHARRKVIIKGQVIEKY